MKSYSPFIVLFLVAFAFAMPPTTNDDPDTNEPMDNNNIGNPEVIRNI